MANTSNMIRIVGMLLITFSLTGFKVDPDPEPDPTSRSFISVFDNKRKRADRYFNNFEYKSAIKLYNKLINKGKADDQIKLRLAESYLKINDLVNAEMWFAEVIHSDRVTPQHQIQYAHTLLSNGNYEQAREVINSYEFADSDYRSQAIINTLNKLEIYYADSTFYHLNPVEDNKPQYSDFSPTIYKDGIVFVSSRRDKGPKFKWDETPFLDLYYTETDVASARPFSENLNSRYHEGPIAFYDGYTKSIFTRSNYLEKELGVTDQGINNLQLYTAIWNDTKNDWEDIEPVSFMVRNYSYGHPSVSADNNRLYFISDMPGGFGGTDIYVSERNATGFGEPVNMGETINTAGNEMYPFIDDVDNLYFASNGHGGLGGLDVFQIQLEGTMDLRNMGYPLNTTADDFGFLLTSDGEIAYISSNREGADNIFLMDIKAPDLEMILADNSVNGTTPSIDQEIEPLAVAELSTIMEIDQLDEVAELSTINAFIVGPDNQALTNARIKLLENGEEIETLRSDSEGNVSIQLPPDAEYTIVASKEGFENRTIVLPAESLGQQEDLLLVLNSDSFDPNMTGNQMSTTELDPLVVSDSALEDSGLDLDQRTHLEGVALTEFPEWSEETTDEVPATELDPLAVTDDGIGESILDSSTRPQIEGVPLTDLPHDYEDAENQTPITETEATMTEEQLSSTKLEAGIADNQIPSAELDPRNQDQISATESETATEDQLSTNELDPLAVSDSALEDSGLDLDQRTHLEGVALTELPEWSEETTVEVPTTELDPLAVTDDGIGESILDSSTRSEIEGVPLADLPQDHEGAENQTPITETEATMTEEQQSSTKLEAGIADNQIPSAELDPHNQDQIPGTESETATENQMSTTELDPLAVSDSALEDSGLALDQRTHLEGVALTELPEWSEETTDEVPATELDPLAVTDDGIGESILDSSTRPEIEGVPLTDLPQDYEGAENQRLNTESEATMIEEQLSSAGLEPGMTYDQMSTNELDPDTENQMSTNELGPDTGNEMSTNELDPLAVSDSALEDSGLDPDQPNQFEGVALTEFPEWSEETTDEVPTTERDPLAVTDDLYTELPSETKLVETAVVDANTGEHLNSADIKLFVDSPNQALDYELKDGVLTFEAKAHEDYIIVASHDDYQDEYITLSGDELLDQKQDRINLELTQSGDVVPTTDQQSGPSTKFKALIRDQETGEQISDAEVKFFVDGKAIESEYSKENGKTLFKSPPGEDYLMLVSREGYQDLIYHLPGIPEENMDVDLSLYKEVDGQPFSPYRLLTVKSHAFDDFSGSDLNGVNFKVFENGDLIETSSNLSALEVDPDNNYQVLATKEGYLESLFTISPEHLESNETLVLPFGLQREQVSEVTGTQVNPDVDGQTYPVSARIADITDDKPIPEALVIVFADDKVQDKMNTWQTGMVTINTLPGKDYQLVVKREGYNDRIINVGQISTRVNPDLQISLVPQEIQKLRHNEIDLSNANLLVMTGPNGEEQLYLSTSDELYQYSVENENHYLVSDDKKILLKERTRSLDSKVTTKQDSDQFNLRTEDQFLYDQLSADEKAMIDKIAERMNLGELSNDPELAIYYNNLPEEYRNLAENMATLYRGDDLQELEPALASAKLLNSALAENQVAVSKVFNINSIYYDFDKSAIREDAAIELDKLILIMKSNESIKVMMFSHTDSRGSNNYNEGLSKRRGMAAVRYLTERGISIDRLTAEGRGETQLVNPCTNSVNCPEEAHQLNRRTEFILRS